MTTSDGNREPGPPGALPDGLYVRHASECGAQRPLADEIVALQTRQWYITGRSPDFWWDLVIMSWCAGDRRYQLHCTRCGLRDEAAAIDDLLLLIHCGAHFHDTDPASLGVIHAPHE